MTFVHYLIMFTFGVVLIIGVGFLLFRRVSVQQWASFFTSEEYHQFTQQIKSWFETRGLYATIDEGIVTAGTKPADDRKLDLAGLAQACEAATPSSWPEIIDDHFSFQLEALENTEALQADIRHFDRVRHLLAVRLMPRRFIDAPDAAAATLVLREDLEDVFTVLVFDLPTRVQTVLRSEARLWEIDDEELFRLGRDNVRDNCRPDAGQETLPNGVVITALTGSTMFVSTHALLIQDHPERIGPGGALVGVPDRGSLLLSPIASRRATAAAEAMIPMIYGMHRDGPGPVSAHLYWYRDGGFTTLPYSGDAQSFSFNPPVEFTTMLEQLDG
jgi:hypothetical protein